jgi:hypothetical protein
LRAIFIVPGGAVEGLARVQADVDGKDLAPGIGFVDIDAGDVA